MTLNQRRTFLVAFGGVLVASRIFDTVDHTILLNKLKWLGADVLTVQWFRSYLTGRTQVTDIDGTMSEPKGVTC